MDDSWKCIAAVGLSLAALAAALSSGGANQPPGKSFQELQTIERLHKELDKSSCTGCHTPKAPPTLVPGSGS